MSASSRAAAGAHRASGASNSNVLYNPTKVREMNEAARIERERIQKEKKSLAAAEKKERGLAQQEAKREMRRLRDSDATMEDEDLLSGAMFATMTLSDSIESCEQPAPMTVSAPPADVPREPTPESVPQPVPQPGPVAGRRTDDEKKRDQFVGLTPVQLAFCSMLNTVMSPMLITFKIQENIRDKDEEGNMPFINLQKFLANFPTILTWWTTSKTSALKKHLKALTEEERAHFEALTAQDADWIIRNAMKCSDDLVIKAYRITEQGHIRHNRNADDTPALTTFVSATPEVLEGRKIVTVRRKLAVQSSSGAAAGMDLA